jgi:hypothetical protein
MQQLPPANSRTSSNIARAPRRRKHRRRSAAAAGQHSIMMPRPTLFGVALLRTLILGDSYCFRTDSSYIWGLHKQNGLVGGANLRIASSFCFATDRTVTAASPWVYTQSVTDYCVD